MRVHVSTFLLPKNGSQPEEYEDSSWVGPGGEIAGDWEGRSLRVAVADGASESMLASRWARRLVSTFGEAKSRARLATVLRRAVNGWNAEVDAYIAEREKRGKPIQWFEEPGLMRGAYATALFVEFAESDSALSGQWVASALGDSCMFQIRDESLALAFPIASASEFDYSPALVQSRPADFKLLLKNANSKTGNWESGDSFYLATDALAAWFLADLEAGGKPWATLRDLDTEEGPEFPSWVAECRAERAMRNDDVTLVRIDVL